MTVRETAKTTLSVVILSIGFYFLRSYYIELVSKLAGFVFRHEWYLPVIVGKLFPDNYIGAYFPALFYFGVIVIIAIRMLDVIFDHKVALQLISCFVRPLLLAVVATIALCIEQINLLQLWAIFYVCMIICLHSTFKKIAPHAESIGRYADLKLIKGFFLTIKNTILKVISAGIRGFRNPIDEIISLSASALVLLLEVVALISFIIYLLIHWRLIFLSHLIS